MLNATQMGQWNGNPDEMHGILSSDNTFLLDYSAHSPQDWAIPLYGYAMPILVAVTAVTNSFIIIVLSQRHLRTPTNSVLLAMAIADLLTGVASSPWFVYYYTFKRYELDNVSGLSGFWCHAYGYLFELLPSAFHTAATWLAAFLAIQRYIYVCVPSHVFSFCTPKTTNWTIFGIFVASFVILLPDLTTRQRFVHHNEYTKRKECYIYFADWLDIIGRDLIFSIHSWVRIILHAVPCILLLIFTTKLSVALYEAENRKKSWAVVDNPKKIGYRGQRRGSLSGGRSLYATNRMLAVICSLFLLLEIPAVILHGIQFVIAIAGFRPDQEIITWLNKGLILRNVIIVMASPIQFAIYCSMSEQFRLTVRQLFTKRLLFVAKPQATFHSGKRYSLVLIDVDYGDIKPGTTGMRCFACLSKDTNECSPLKISRQTSVLGCEKKSVKFNQGTPTRIRQGEETSILRHHDVLTF